MIRKLLGLVFNRWVLLAVLLLALVAGGLDRRARWSALPSAQPLETERSRWIAIGALVAALAFALAWKAWRARRGNNAVVSHLLAAPADSEKEAESADMPAVRQRFEQALVDAAARTLRQRRARCKAGRPGSAGAISTSCRGT